MVLRGEEEKPPASPGRPRVTRILLASGWGGCRSEWDMEELDSWPEGPSEFGDLPPLATTSVKIRPGNSN